MNKRLELVDKTKRLIKERKFWLAFCFLIIGVFINQISALFLKYKYQSNLPIIPDIILDNIPYFHIAWLYDFLAVFPIVFFLIYAYKKGFKEVPYFIFLFGILQVLRGVFIMLTPFGQPNGDELGLFKSTMMIAGVYPSGHVGSAFLAFLLSKGGYKWTILGFLIGVITTLLLGRGHYSIDIFSALIFASAVYFFGEKHLKKRLSIK